MSTSTLSPAVQARILPIKLLVLDVDGVLSNGQIILGEQGQEFKIFNALDGQGLKLLQRVGIQIGIISGRQSAAVTQRMRELNIDIVHQGIADKLPVLEAVVTELALSLEQTAYIGDDLPDLPCIQAAGLGVTVANGVEAVKQQADWQTRLNGGHGAVREICDLILTVQGHWPTLQQHLAEKNA